MTNGKLKRFLAFLLSFTMILSMNSMSVFAEETYSETENAIVYTVDPETGETPAYQESEPAQTETQIQESQTSAETGAGESVKETAASTESAKETIKESESETDTEETESETETKAVDDGGGYDANLNSFVTSLNITGLTKKDGKYIFKEGQEFTFTVGFQEAYGHQFVNTNQTMVYTLPAGVESVFASGSTFDITITDAASGKDYTITGNTYSVSGNQLNVNWNTAHPNFKYLQGATNAYFTLTCKGHFSKDAHKIDWGGGYSIDVDLDKSHSVTISKSGNLDTNTGKATYKVRVTSTGKNENVVVRDVVTGSLVTNNRDVAISYTNNNRKMSDFTVNSNGDKGFSITIPEMADGEVVEFSYSANINLAGVTAEKLDANTTKNTAYVKANDTPEVHSDKTFTNTIIHNQKDHTTVTNEGLVHWVTTVNQGKIVSMKGVTVRDYLDWNKEITQYTGTGVTVYKNGAFYKTLTWAELGVTSTSKEWTWTIPDDGKYEWKFEYDTKTDVSKNLNSITVRNWCTVSKGNNDYEDGTISIGVGEKPTLEKTHATIADTDTEVTWNLKITLPANKDFVDNKITVTDTLPKHDGYIDEFVAGSVNVTGLKSGETSTINTNDKSKVVITINGIKKSDQPREINITLKTKINPEWVEHAAEDYNAKTHTNKGTLVVNNFSVDKTSSFDKKNVVASIDKIANSSQKTEGGMPAYEFNLVFSGVEAGENNIVINDVFNTELFAIAAGSYNVYAANNTDAGKITNNVGTATVTPTATGATFTATISDAYVEKYDYYKITYRLKVKDADALKTLQALAVDNNGVYEIANTATFKGKSDADSVNYSFKAIEKSLTNKGDLDNNHRMAHYKIELNKDAAMLGDTPTYTVEDQMSKNMQLQTNTITYSADGCSAAYDKESNTITFTIPNGVHVIVEYDALVIADTDKESKVTLTNTATAHGQKSGGAEEKDFSTHGSGGGTLLSATIHKVEDGNISKPVPGAEFDLYDGATKLAHLTTDPNGLISLVSSSAMPLYADHDYRLVETKAPKGYQVSGDPITFQLTEKPSKIQTGYVYFTGSTISVGNKYSAKTSLPISGKKKIDTRDLLKGDEFTFKLYEVVNGAENLIETVTNDAEGNIEFKPLQYSTTKSGITETHEYVIKESNAGKTINSVTYAKDPVKFTVTVKDNGDGTMTATAPDDVNLNFEFVNTYEEKGEVAFEGKKVLNGKKIEANQFTFELYEGGIDEIEGKSPIQTKKNAADGTIKFDKINYSSKKDTDLGTHKYTIVEVPGDDTGITYDSHPEEITVNVQMKRDGSGELNVQPSGNALNFTFTNEYNASGSATFKGHKVLENRDDDKEFTFVLSEVIDGKEVELQTVKNDADGNILFADVQYTQDNIGTHTYTVKEVDDKQAGITYDGTVYTVTYEVKATKTADLDVKEVTNKATALNFNNTYKATGSQPFHGKKTLENRDEDKKFTFVLIEEFENGTTKELQRVKNEADGNIPFTDIQYTEENIGTHKYTVKEVDDRQPGITYDTTVYDVIVNVTANKTTTLTVDATEGDDPSALDFTNEYHASGEAVFKGTKVLEYRNIKAEEFTFELYEVDKDENEILIESVPNNGKGAVVFTGIPYTEEDYGTYNFRVKEVIEESDCVVYDKTVKEYTVTVKPSKTEKLDIQISEDGENFTFTNTYEATGSQPFTGKKVLEHRDLKDEEFTFVLSEIIGDEEVELQTVKNDADGNIPFEAINYDQTNIGTHTYKVKELIPEETASGIEYDETVYTVVVEVKATDTKDLSVVATEGDPAALNFTNKYHGTGSQPFYGVKSLDRYPLAKDNFTFELYELAEDGTEELLQSVKNDGEGNIAFEAVNYTEDDLGDHTYTVKEVKEDQKGVTYDAKVYTVKVTVKAGEDDKLVIETEGDDPTALKFENLYRDSKVTVTARKVFIGEPIEDGQFKFHLKGIEGTNTEDVDMTAPCKADGSIAFDELVYTDEGTYKYTLSEIIPEKDDPDFDPEMGYDTNVYDITVVVTIDPETHDVTADYSVVGEYAYPLFVNRTNIGNLETQIQLGAKKELKGGELRDDQFEFVLKSTGYPDKYYPETGDFEKGEFTKFESITVKNKADGTIALPVIYMNTVGNYTFDMYEVAGDSPLYKYDDTVHKVVVTTDTDDMGKLVVTNVTIDGVATTDYTMTFVNEKSEAKPVKVKVSAKKVLKGGTLTANMFEFALKGTSDNTDKKEVVVKNDASGNVTFPEMEYKEAGTYTYDLYEIKGTNALMKYDTTVHKVVVEVTENEKTGEFEAVVKTDEKDAAATFTNTLTPSGGGGGGGVGTGDHTPVMALMLIMLLSAAVIAFIFFKKKKRA